MFMPEKNRYPDQLATMLGNDYTVKLNDKSIYDQSKTPNLKELLATFEQIDVKKGDIILLDLNNIIDSLQNDSDQSGRLIEKIQSSQKTGARIVLLARPAITKNQESSNSVKQLQELAYQNNVEIVDFSRLLNGVSLDENQLLTSIGATAVSRRLYELIKTPILSSKNKKPINIKESKASNFHGYSSLTFEFNNKEVKIVQPKVVAEGKPWVWRARFWGHEPQLDIAMLERGYHIVYCDVAELYGNPTNIHLWDQFYKFLIKRDFNKRAVMEGMSRGGIYVYNWLLKYPNRVSAVYADAPVLNFQSWPGGKGKGKGSVGDWGLFKNDYKLSEQEALDYKMSPLNKAAEIGRLNIPIIHVIGDKDDIVPPEENTLPFAKEIIAAGGNIEVIHKKEVGHHPHSLVDPTPIVNFLLRAENRKINFASIAVAGSEYRSGAGWKFNRGWWVEHKDIDSILSSKKGQLDILFVDNSITQGIGGTRQVTGKPGYAAFSSVFKDYNWDCAGISGDRTQNVLWRLKNGKYKYAAPAIIVLTIGVNNFIEGDSAEEIASGILEIKRWINANMKDSKLILTGPLPTGLSKNSPARVKYEKVHRLLKAAVNNDKSNKYLPLHDVFVQDDGSLSLADYSADGIHLSGGYVKWTKALFSIIDKL